MSNDITVDLSSLFANITAEIEAAADRVVH